MSSRDISRAHDEGNPTVKTIIPNSSMSIAVEFANKWTRGAQIAAWAIGAVLVLSVSRTGAQTTDAAKAPSAAAKSAETLTPAERDRLMKQLADLDREAAENIQNRRFVEAKIGLERSLQILKQLYPETRFPNGQADMPPVLTRLGWIEMSLGQYPQALEHFRKSLAMIKALALRGEPWRETNLTSLVRPIIIGGTRLNDTLQRSDEAERYFRLALEAIELMESKPASSRLRNGLLATTWSALGRCLRDQEKYVESEAGFRRCLELGAPLQAIFPAGQGDVLIATVSHDLGAVLFCQGKSAEAIEIWQKTLAMWQRLYPEKSHPNGHPEVLNTLAALGEGYFHQHRLAQAASAWREALAMARRLDLGDGNVAVFKSLPTTHHLLWRLGRVLLMRGDSAEAEICLRDSLAICQKLYPNREYPQGHPQLALTLGELGSVLADKGDYGGAMRLLKRSLAMNMAPGDLARLLDELASVYMRLGERRPARDCAAAALQLREQTYTREKFPIGHRDLASSMLRLASVLDEPESTWVYRVGTAKKNIDSVGELYRRALEMCRSLYPEKDYPSGQFELANALWWSGQWDVNWNVDDPKGLPIAERGRLQCQKSIEMLEKVYPKNQYPMGHPLLAERLSEMGAVLANLSEYDSAIEYARRGLEMSERLYSRDRFANGHPALVRALYNAGMIHVSKGYSLAAVDRRKDLAQDEYKHAWDVLRRCHRMSEDWVCIMLGDCPEAQAWNFRSAQPPALELMIFLAGEVIPDTPEVLYDAVADRKATLLRASQRRRRLVAESKDPEVKSLAQKLEQNRRELAAALLTATDDDMKSRGTAHELTWRKERLELALAERLPRYDPARERSVQASELRRSLPANSALVEIVALRLAVPIPNASPGKLGRADRYREGVYHAFIVRPDAPTFWLKIGGPSSTDLLIHRWREAIARNDPSAIRWAYTLRDLVWTHIERHLGPSTATVYIAPDGTLSQIPWAALPSRGANRVLLEDYALAVVPNGLYALEQFASQPRRQDRSVGRFLGVGDVSYDRHLGPRELTGFAKTSRSVQRQGKAAVWLPLPGTRAELDAIAAIAGSHETTLLIGPEATTGRILDELPKARWAHVATHGFFDDPARFLNSNTLQVTEMKGGGLDHFKERSVKFSDLEQEIFPGLGNAFYLDVGGIHRRERYLPFERDPEAFSGLVLAGANLPVPVDRDGVVSGDSGIVTADAITGLPRNNLDLLVLSACETGLGDSGYSVGVTGLQRSFHAAGARDVVASLWKVDDDATAALMHLFYHKLWVELKSPMEAQLAIYYHPERVKDLARTRGVDFTKEVEIVHSRKPEMLPKTGRAPAKIWAAFVLSGADSPTKSAVLYNLADAMKGMGAADQAMLEGIEAIRLKPDDVAAHLKLGSALVQEEAFEPRDHRESIDHLRKSIQLKPDLAEAHYQLGAALHRNWSRSSRTELERLAGAKPQSGPKPTQELAQAVDLRPVDKWEEELAQAAKKELAQAVDALRCAVKLQAGNAGWHHDLGIALRDQGKFDEAIEEFNATMRLKPDDAAAHGTLGGTLHRVGRFDEAIAAFRQAIRLKPELMLAHYYLGSSLQRQGDWESAVASLRRARTLAASDTRITSVIDKELQTAARLAALAPRLPAVIKNTDRPANAAEFADFGQLALSHAHYAVACRLYADAFGADPRLGDDLDAAHRYSAACSAALAGSGRGKDDPAPDEAGQAKLRRQALDWLTADLVLRKRELESEKPEDRADVGQTLAYWKADRDLAGVRDADALAKLPDDEQKAWRALWAEVDALEKKARGTGP